MLDDYQPRAVDGLIDELFTGLPALMIVGPRATGKTTTASRHARTVVKLDDEHQGTAFRSDPDRSLAAEAEPVLLDEWQSAPEVLGAVKRTLDAEPTRPGRFLLTGSVNADLEAETWPGTGRVVRVAMYGMTVAEQRGRIDSAFLDRVLASDEPDVPEDTPDLRGYVQLALQSGFPEVLRPGLTAMQQERWLESYVDQLVTRDARMSGGTRDPVLLRRFLDAYALNSAGITESKRIYDAAGISRPTGVDYERLLLNLWIIDNVPAWTPNRLKRLVRSPKRYVVDAGLMVATLRLGVDDVLDDGDLLGRVLDTFVVSQLRAETAWATSRPRLFHLRDQDGRHEVDLVAELRGRKIVGIEVKASGSPGPAAAKHLIWLRDQIGKDFHRGVVLHTGSRTYELDDRITALPIAALW